MVEEKKKEENQPKAQPKADEPGVHDGPRAQKKQKVKLSKKSQDILKAVEGLSVLELNELVKALEEKFGVSAAAVAAPAAVSSGAEGTGAEGAGVVEKAEYDVILAAIGENKISAIKAVREINQELGLKEAKELVESVPKPILKGAKKDDAGEAKKKLEAAGCKVELK